LSLQTSAGLGSLGNLGSLAGLAGGQNAQAASALSGLGGLGALGALGGGGSVPRQDVGTTVQITPHLNDADEIRLEISEEISAAGAPEQSGNLGVRSVSRTKAKTEVVVRDQQTVVIGGLMRDQVTTAQSKVPVLGDIPLIGMLFRTTDKSKTKKNLLLFLTPYIIRTPDDLRAIYERKMRERQEFLDRYYIFTGAEYDAPVDYSRTRGLVARMMSELTALEDERKLLADAAAAPPLKHEPRAPVGAAPDRSSGGDGGDAPDGEVVSPADAPQAGSDAPPPPPLVEPAPADQPVVVE
jgi:general secretion pathway protein D